MMFGLRSPRPWMGPRLRGLRRVEARGWQHTTCCLLRSRANLFIGKFRHQAAMARAFARQTETREIAARSPVRLRTGSGPRRPRDDQARGGLKSGRPARDAGLCSQPIVKAWWLISGGDQCDRQRLCCNVTQTMAAMSGQLLLGRAIVRRSGIEICGDRGRARVCKGEIAIGAMERVTAAARTRAWR